MAFEDDRRIRNTQYEAFAVEKIETTKKCKIFLYAKFVLQAKIGPDLMLTQKKFFSAVSIISTA